MEGPKAWRLRVCGGESWRFLQLYSFAILYSLSIPIWPYLLPHVLLESAPISANQIVRQVRNSLPEFLSALSRILYYVLYRFVCLACKLE